MWRLCWHQVSGYFLPQTSLYLSCLSDRISGEKLSSGRTDTRKRWRNIHVVFNSIFIQHFWEYCRLLELLLAHWFQDLFWENLEKCIFHILNIIGRIRVIQELTRSWESSNFNWQFQMSWSIYIMFHIYDILPMTISDHGPVIGVTETGFATFLLWKRRMAIIITTNKQTLNNWWIFFTKVFLFKSFYKID